MNATQKKFSGPYATRAARREAMMLELVSGLPPTVGLAFIAQCNADLRLKKRMVITPHHLARLSKCHVTTIYRSIPLALELGVIEVVQAGSRGRKLATLYRLTEVWPAWGGTHEALKKNPEERTAFCNMSLVPTELKINSTPIPPQGGEPELPGSDSVFGDERVLKERKDLPEPQSDPATEGQEPLVGGSECPTVVQEPPPEPPHTEQAPNPGQTLEAALVAALVEGEAFPGTAKAVAIKARLEGRVAQALADVRSVLPYLQSRPAWVRPGSKIGGLVVAAAQSPLRAAKIRAQAAFKPRQRSKPPKPPTPTSEGNLGAAIAIEPKVDTRWAQYDWANTYMLEDEMRDWPEAWKAEMAGIRPNTKGFQDAFYRVWRAHRDEL